MKTKAFYIIGIMICFTLSFFLLTKMKDTKSANRQSDVSTSIEILTPLIDVGELPLNSKVSASFLIKNTGNNPFLIRTIKTDCDCTIAETGKKSIAPNDTLYVDVSYKNSHLPGFFRRIIEIEGNVDKSSINLEFRGEIKDR